MRLFRISALALACGAAAYALPPAYAAWGGPGDPKARFERFCSNDKFGEKISEMQAKKAEMLAEKLKLTDAQKAAFKEYQDIRAKAAADGRAAFCASKPTEVSFEKRLELRQTRLQTRLDTLKAEQPKLLAFYNSLNDYQKGQFDEMSKHLGGDHGGWGHKGWSGEGEHEHEHHHDD